MSGEMILTHWGAPVAHKILSSSRLIATVFLVWSVAYFGTLVLFLAASQGLRRFGRNLQQAFLLMGPVFSVKLFRLSRFAFLFFALHLGVYALSGFESYIELPSHSSAEYQTSVAVGGYFVLLFARAIMRGLGFPPGVDKALWSKSDTALSVFLWIEAVGFVLNPTWLGWVCYPLALYNTALEVFLVSRIAKLTFDGAPQAVNQPCALSHPLNPDQLLVVHATDVHTTAPSVERLEKGEGGQGRLHSLLSSCRAQYLLLTGDLVDSGHPSEWSVAMPMLQDAVRRQVMHRILLAPGNHDLATAYTGDDYFVSLFREKPGVPLQMVGARLKAFLSNAAALEPALELSSGEALSSVLAHHASLLGELRDIWAATIDRMKAKESLALAGELFAQKAHGILPEVGDLDHWTKLFRRAMYGQIMPDKFVRRMDDELFNLHWYDFFPLFLFEQERDTLFVILNSVDPNPTMLGSAWGRWGTEQLGRLRSYLDSVTASRVYVLVHHSPYRWSDEQFSYSFAQIQRWALLSASRWESEELQELLEGYALAAPSREINMFCGHRHGGAKAESRVGTWKAVRVIESAALADPGTSIVCGESTASGSLTFALLRVRGLKSPPTTTEPPPSAAGYSAPPAGSRGS